MDDLEYIIRIFKYLFSFIGRAFFWISYTIFVTAEDKTRTKWMKDKGDSTLRFDYDLDSSSLVFDLGGYDGRWSTEIFARYLSTIYIFEPVGSYYNAISKRFKKNPRVQCYNFGLAEKDKVELISVDGIASSTFIKNKKTESIKLYDILGFINEHNIDSIDLMKINIEGGEYDLLEYLIKSSYIKRIKNIQVQFHSFVPDAKKRMRNIQNLISRTHYTTYSYEFVFENWRLKENIYEANED